jgi:transcriptional regulator with XRE-family HTH domain
MYEQIRQDLLSQTKTPLRKRPDFGKAVRSILKDRSEMDAEINVAWLARKSKLNQKTLFNILNGNIQNPSWDKLEAIAEALSVDVTDLIKHAREEQEGHFFISGFKERAVLQYAQHGFQLIVLTPPGAGSRRFFMGLMSIDPQRELSKWKLPDRTMVCAYITDGTLEIELAGNKKHVVTANESVYFDASIEHTLRNIDTVTTKLFIATHPSMY